MYLHLLFLFVCFFFPVRLSSLFLSVREGRGIQCWSTPHTEIFLSDKVEKYTVLSNMG